MALWNLEGLSILIVDDFPQMRSMLKSMVQQYNPKEILQAADGEEAISQIEKKSFDIIFCDYNLGEGKDGQQVLEEAKYRGLIPYSTIFLMVTAENTTNMVMGAVEYQPDGYLAKPVNKTILVSRLQKLLEKKNGMKKLSSLMEDGNIGAAIQECDQLLQENPKHKLELLKLKCDLLLKLNDYEAIEKIVKSVIEVREIPWAVFDLGIVQFQRKEYEAAKETFEHVISLNKSFVSAYDWLARVVSKLGDKQKAQEILQEAVDQSSKSIHRQRALADISTENKDYGLAEKAHKQVVKIGKTSCLKEPSDYTRLAKVLVQNDSGKEAIKVLDNVKYVFKKDPRAELESAIASADVHKSMGNKSEYESAVKAALEQYKKDPSMLKGEAALDMAKVCLDTGNEEAADEIIQTIAKEHHEDEELLGKVGKIYSDAGKEGQGKELIEKARKEVVEINNRGVELIKAGEVDEAIQLFTRAVNELPENRVINLNAAQALILHMKKNGVSKKSKEDACRYIDVALQQDPGDEKANKLRAVCLQL